MNKLDYPRRNGTHKVRITRKLSKIYFIFKYPLLINYLSYLQYCVQGTWRERIYFVSIYELYQSYRIGHLELFVINI